MIDFLPLNIENNTFEIGPLRVSDRRREFPQTLCKGHLMVSSFHI
jgi:hypothetical protein